MENPVISIIIPVYNVEKYLERCMNSVVKQTYTKLEIIVVDDGSTDSCPQMCDKFAQKDERIRVIHKKNGGLSSARNAGIDAATGDFLMFVDSDDYIALETCAIVVSKIDDGTDIVSFLFQRVYDNPNLNEKIKENDETKIVLGRELFKNYINRTDFTHMVCDKAFRRELFDGVRFIEGRLAEDMAICYKLIGKADAAVSINQVFYYYYMRENSIMGKGSIKLFLDAYRGECEAYEYGNRFFPEFKRENDIRFLNQSMKTYLKLLYLHGDEVKDSDLNMIMSNIKNIKKSEISFKSRAFCTIFNICKPVAWKVFKILKLS